ncbi:T9SS type A sorting domain-containing protein, partial [Sphingobacteriaceae bacterium AH-315-L07]|nr:T9SS type A sorting domain-containing protein [Sphingobacteriaceae bacterium AH-315-L07]MBN4052273.1 T9SS type A sorting domain-containing protein [Sphingobacteriaceae bacterium AH-315-L07]
LPSGIVLVSDMQTGLYVFDVSKAVVSTKEIEVISESEINIYPNPVIDQVTIEINSPDIQKINSVSIYDFSGKLITNEVFGNNNGSTRKTITLDHMPAGLYTVKVNSDHYLGIKKLIKVN